MKVVLATAVIASRTVNVAQVIAVWSIFHTGEPKDIVAIILTRVTGENHATLMTSARKYAAKLRTSVLENVLNLNLMTFPDHEFHEIT